jgi:hypothetical protein
MRSWRWRWLILAVAMARHRLSPTMSSLFGRRGMIAIWVANQRGKSDLPAENIEICLGSVESSI